MVEQQAESWDTSAVKNPAVGDRVLSYHAPTTAYYSSTIAEIKKVMYLYMTVECIILCLPNIYKNLFLF